MAVAAAVLYTAGSLGGVSGLSGAELRHWLTATPVPAPVAFIVLFLVLNTVALPAPLLGATAGVAFGPLPGTALTLLALTLTAGAQFTFARHLGGDRLRARLAARLGRAGRLIEQRGVLTVAAVRLLPGPFSELNLVAGLTPICLRDFMLGTALGGAPKAALWVGVGAVLLGS